MEILFATDDSYAKHLAVALLSLFRLHDGRKLTITIALTDVSEANRRKLEAVCVAQLPMRFRFVELRAEHCPAAYARLFAPHLVPGGVRKLLYLNCDVLVCDTLDELWNADVAGVAAAAVEEPSTAALGGDRTAARMNAGVMLINLDRWRAGNVSARLADFVRAVQPRSKQHAQDALNACLGDEIVALPKRWNVTHEWYTKTARELNVPFSEYAAVRRNPGIVHFTDPCKPWNYATVHPYQGAYRRFLKHTPFFEPYRGVSPRSAVAKHYQLAKRALHDLSASMFTF